MTPAPALDLTTSATVSELLSHFCDQKGGAVNLQRIQGAAQQRGAETDQILGFWGHIRRGVASTCRSFLKMTGCIYWHT